MDKLLFQLRKYFTLAWVYVVSKINPWKRVEGIYLPVNLSIGFNVVRWILNGRYEEGEINIIKNRLSDRDIVFEIGTGLGFISTYCSKCIGSKNVFTYEANVMNIPVCNEVFIKNNVSPNLANAFLSETAGEFLFPIDKNNRLASSVLIQKNDTVSIPMYCLNDEIKKRLPTFLIMDIEGGEYDIFSIIDFQSINKVQFEIHPSIIGNEKCEKIFRILTANNFTVDKDVSSGANFYFFR